MAKHKTVKFLLNVGTLDQQTYRIPDSEEGSFPPREGEVMSLDEDLANLLIDGKRWAILYDKAAADAEALAAKQSHDASVAAMRPLAERELALEEAKDAVKAEAKAPVKKHQVDTPADESEVSAVNADEAIAQVGNMRNRDKLQHIVSTDPRATVKAAAQKRLDSLPK